MRAASILIALSGAVASVSAAHLFPRQYPSCANPCIANASIGTCDPSDLGCLCKDPDFISSTTTCIISSCSASDALSAEAVARQFCETVGVTLTSTPAVSTPAGSSTASAPSASSAPASSASSAPVASASSAPAASSASKTSAAGSSAPSSTPTTPSSSSGSASGSAAPAATSTTPNGAMTHGTNALVGLGAIFLLAFAL